MAQDVTIGVGPTRRAETLSDDDQARLRRLSGKPQLSPDEQFDLGALRARARSSPEGRRLLDNLTAEQAARQASRRGRPVTRGEATAAIGEAVAAAITRALDDEDDRPHLRRGW